MAAPVLSLGEQGYELNGYKIYRNGRNKTLDTP
jgi:hypothetical protein